MAQIRRTGEEGRGLAVTGLIIGYVFTAIGVLFIIFWIVVFAWLANSVDSNLRSTTPTYGTYATPTPTWTAPTG